MTQVPYLRYEGIPLQQMFDWVHHGPGAAALRPMQDGLNSVGRAFADSSINIRSTLQSLGIEWHGTAASAAGAALAAVGQSGAAKGESAEKAGNNAEAHGVDFEQLRSKVAYQDPGPYSFWQQFWDSAWGPAGSWLGTQSDYRDALEQNEAARGEAVRAMYDYEQQARDRVATFPAAVDDPRLGGTGGGGSPGGVGGIPHVPPGGLGAGVPGVVPPPGGGTGLGGVGGLGMGGGAGSGGRADGGLGTSAIGPPGPGAAGSPGGPGAGAFSTPQGITPAPHPSVPAPGGNLPPPGSAVPAAPPPLVPGIPIGAPVPPGSSAPRSSSAGPPSTGRAFRADLLRSAEPNPAGPRGPGGRATEPGTPARGNSGATSSSVYPPMGGATGRNGTQSHRTRYSIPSSDPFEVEVPHVAPVIGGEEP
ncbi:hypothetical protein PSD17_24690 [Pseudonocardia sp. D17]|nr:hypothetical protein PSD17_24690 [Pseudonocardia sp. D17]